MALSKAEARDIEAPANLDQIDKLDQLTPLVEELEAKKAAKSPPPPAPPAPGAGGSRVGGPPPAPSEATLPPEKKIVATSYKVNEGKSLQTKRGVIGALEHVWPTDFGGGQADLDHWVANGYVTKTEHLEQ